MPSDRLATCFRDIIAAADLIEDWVKQAGGIENALHHNVLVRSAIERQLLIVSEAAIRLGKLSPDLESLAPGIDWSGIRGIGNFIRHKYDDLDAQVIAGVLQSKLATLRIAARTALTTLDGTD